MNAPALRVRSIGEILDAAFQLYRAHMVPMVTATGMFILPILLLQAVVPEEFLGVVDRVSNIFFMAASAAVVLIASEGYMGRQLDGVTAVKQVNGRFLSVWGAAIIQGLMIGIGFILLVIPGLIAAAWTFGMQQAVMIEGRKANDSFERSRDLARGHLMHVLLTAVMTLVITFVAVLGVMVVLGYVFTGTRALALVSTMVLILLNPLAAVVNTVLYYDLRIRKEGYDVEVYAERMGEGVPVAG